MEQKMIDEIRERCDTATRGPWNYNEILEPYGNRGQKFIYVRNADANFIAHARQDVPALLDYVAALQAENERLKARAEALERAIKECKVKDECDLKCHMCVNEGCEGYYDRDGDDRWIDGECDWCVNRSKWQFDEARFTGGERE